MVFKLEKTLESLLAPIELEKIVKEEFVWMRSTPNHPEYPGFDSEVSEKSKSQHFPSTYLINTWK